MNKRNMGRLAGFSFYSALIKIAWGLVLLAPANTFAFAASYNAMSNIADEDTWGIVLVMVGMLHIASIFSYRLIARIIMQIVSIAFWLFLATMFLISNPVGAGVWIYGIAAICDFIAIVYLLRYEKGEYI